MVKSSVPLLGLNGPDERRASPRRQDCVEFVRANQWRNYRIQLRPPIWSRGIVTMLVAYDCARIVSR